IPTCCMSAWKRRVRTFTERTAPCSDCFEATTPGIRPRIGFAYQLTRPIPEDIAVGLVPTAICFLSILPIQTLFSWLARPRCGHVRAAAGLLGGPGSFRAQTFTFLSGAVIV